MNNNIENKTYGELFEECKRSRNIKAVKVLYAELVAVGMDALGGDYAAYAMFRLLRRVEDVDLLLTILEEEFAGKAPTMREAAEEYLEWLKELGVEGVEERKRLAQMKEMGGVQ